jgi:protease IV
MFSIFNTPLLISEAEANSLLPIFLAGHHHLLIPKKKEAMAMLAATADNASTSNQKPQSGTVAVIPVIGVITKNGDACSLGTDEIGQYITDANADKSVSAICLKIDSPGGTVDGTVQLAKIIANSQKPITAFVSLACSGAAWLATQCDEIYLEDPDTTRIGSLSAFFIYENVAEKLKKEGIHVEIIRASDSPKKFKPNAIEPLTEPERKAIIAEGDRFKSLFKAAITSGRGDRFKATDAHFEGQVFDANTAIADGLADGFGSLTFAVNRAYSLSQISTNNHQSKMEKPQFMVAIGKMLGFSADTTLSETDTLAKLKTLIETQTTQLNTQSTIIDGFAAQKAAFEATATATAAKITALEGTVSTQKTEIETLETQLANAPKPIAQTKDALQKTNTSNYKAQMEALPDGHPDKEAYKVWCEINGIQ